MSDFRYISSGGDILYLDNEYISSDGAYGIRINKTTVEHGYKTVRVHKAGSRDGELRATFTRKDDANHAQRIVDAECDCNDIGKFVIGEWEIRAKLTGLIVENESGGGITVRLLCALIDNAWTKGTLIHMFPYSGEMEGTKKYPYKYPYKYASEYGVRTITVNSPISADFQLCIFGYVRDPIIKIGSNVYRINTIVPAGGYLLLDSRDCTAKVVTADGAITNVFDKCTRGTGENSGNYAWQKIKAGVSNVVWNDTFGFDIVLFEASGTPPFGDVLCA